VLSSGKVQAATVSKHLGMSARSLSWHLAQEWTSFGDVLDELRHRLAVRYLEDKQIALSRRLGCWAIRGGVSTSPLPSTKRDWNSPSRARNLPELGCDCHHSLCPRLPGASSFPALSRSISGCCAQPDRPLPKARDAKICALLMRDHSRASRGRPTCAVVSTIPVPEVVAAFAPALCAPPIKLPGGAISCPRLQQWRQCSG
jgi:AraC-like DNA-binding protein